MTERYNQHPVFYLKKCEGLSFLMTYIQVKNHLLYKSKEDITHEKNLLLPRTNKDYRKCDGYAYDVTIGVLV